jgi:hypothetical protein
VGQSGDAVFTDAHHARFDKVFDLLTERMDLTMKQGQKVTFTDEHGVTRRGQVVSETHVLVGDEERLHSVNVRTSSSTWAVRPGDVD